MNMGKRTGMTAWALSVAVLGLWVLFMPDAAAQSRGGSRAQTRSRSIRVPRQSGGGLRAPSRSSRFGHGGLSGLSGLSSGSGRSSSRNPFKGSSRSGSPGLRALGDLLESAAHDYRGGGHDHGYSDAEAYRDVGIANAIVGLVGILVDAGRNQAYAPAAPVEVVPPPVAVAPPPPVEVVPVPSGYPVAVVPAPPVVLQTPAYYAPPRYVHVAPYPSPPPCPRPYPGYSTPCPAPGRYPCYGKSNSGYGQYGTPRTMSVPRTQAVPQTTSVQVSSRSRMRSGPQSGMRTTPRATTVMQTRPVTSRGRTPAPTSSVARTSRPVQRTSVRTPVRSYRRR
jgi:hypothetical protein